MGFFRDPRHSDCALDSAVTLGMKGDAQKAHAVTRSANVRAVTDSPDRARKNTSRRAERSPLLEGELLTVRREVKERRLLLDGVIDL